MSRIIESGNSSLVVERRGHKACTENEVHEARQLQKSLSYYRFPIPKRLNLEQDSSLKYSQFRKSKSTSIIEDLKGLITRKNASS
jgi:hypothetical protein